MLKSWALRNLEFDWLGRVASYVWGVFGAILAWGGLGMRRGGMGVDGVR